MKLMMLFPFAMSAVAQVWVMQTSGTTASLRGVSAVDSKVVWASGAGATWLRTTDGGDHWHAGTVPGAVDAGQALDFRGIRAVSATTAYLMSAGPGAKSQIYKTTDAGVSWKRQFTNPDEKGFFDAIAFWDSAHGVVAGDSVDGMITIFLTEDAGEHWIRAKTLAALPGEGAFAASNSCLTVLGSKEAWFGTGGSRVIRTTDGGATWMAAETPVRHDVQSAGIFSLAFMDSSRGVAVGGNYSKDSETAGNIAVTEDGGRTWRAPVAGPNGFRSAVIWLKDRWLVTGTSGSDVSTDGSKTWRRFDSEAFNALAASGNFVWAVGPKGRVARLQE